VRAKNENATPELCWHEEDSPTRWKFCRFRFWPSAPEVNTGKVTPPKAQHNIPYFPVAVHHFS
jgi:hypothetical protein